MRTAKQVREAIVKACFVKQWPASESQARLAVRAVNALFDHDQDMRRQTVMRWLLGKDSSKSLTSGEASALIEWAISEDGKYGANPSAVKEAVLILDEIGLERGQQKLL